MPNIEAQIEKKKFKNRLVEMIPCTFEVDVKGVMANKDICFGLDESSV